MTCFFWQTKIWSPKAMTKGNDNIIGHQKVNLIIASTLMSKMGFSEYVGCEKKQDRKKNTQIYQYVARVDSYVGGSLTSSTFTAPSLRTRKRTYTPENTHCLRIFSKALKYSNSLSSQNSLKYHMINNDKCHSHIQYQ